MFDIHGWVWMEGISTTPTGLVRCIPNYYAEWTLPNLCSEPRTQIMCANLLTVSFILCMSESLIFECTLWVFNMITNLGYPFGSDWMSFETTRLHTRITFTLFNQRLFASQRLAHFKRVHPLFREVDWIENKFCTTKARWSKCFYQ